MQLADAVDEAVEERSGLAAQVGREAVPREGRPEVDDAAQQGVAERPSCLGRRRHLPRRERDVAQGRVDETAGAEEGGARPGRAREEGQECESGRRGRRRGRRGRVRHGEERGDDRLKESRRLEQRVKVVGRRCREARQVHDGGQDDKNSVE